jgi:hypothetical protein
MAAGVFFGVEMSAFDQSESTQRQSDSKLPKPILDAHHLTELINRPVHPFNVHSFPRFTADALIAERGVNLHVYRCGGNRCHSRRTTRLLDRSRVCGARWTHWRNKNPASDVSRFWD